MSAFLKKPQLWRLCKAAGAENISSLMHQELEGIARRSAEIVSKNLSVITEYLGKKTINKRIMQGALDRKISVSSVSKATVTKASGKQVKIKDGDETGLYIDGASAKRLLMHSLKDYMDEIRISEGAMVVFRVWLELFLRELVGNAVAFAKHGKKKTLSPRHVQLALTTSGLTSKSGSMYGITAKFGTYFRPILKVVHPEASLSEPAAESLDGMVNALGHTIGKMARFLISDSLRRPENRRLGEDGKKKQQKSDYGKQGIGSDEIVAATRLILPSELAKHAISEIRKAESALDDETRDKSKKGSRASKAGLIMSVSRAEKIIGVHSKGRISARAPYVLAAVLEYIVTELLDMGGQAARDNKLKTVSPRMLALVVYNDEDLGCLTRNIGWDDVNMKNIIDPQYYIYIDSKKKGF